MGSGLNREEKVGWVLALVPLCLLFQLPCDRLPPLSAAMTAWILKLGAKINPPFLNIAFVAYFVATVGKITTPHSSLPHIMTLLSNLEFQNPLLHQPT